MTPTKRARPASQSQLNAYVESWQSDHHDAMRCADGEDFIAVGLSLYDLFRGQDKFHREMIFRGVSGYFVADSVVFRDGLTAWLNTTQSVLQTQIISLERNYSVNGADRLRECASEVAEYLSNWTPPTISAALGLREFQLDDAAAIEFDRVMGEAKVNPTPMPLGPPMEELSLADFRSRSESK